MQVRVWAVHTKSRMAEDICRGRYWRVWQDYRGVSAGVTVEIRAASRRSVARLARCFVFRCGSEMLFARAETL